MGKFMDFMGTPLGGGAIGAAGGMLDAGIGAVVHNQRETQQSNRQKQFMEMQQKNQKELNQQGYDLQKQMWEETNYAAQVEQLEKAGLSVGNMYGGGGAGGATTGSQSGGSAGSGQAPNNMAPMDVGMTGSGVMGAMAASNIKVNDSIVNLNNEKARKLGGADTEGQNLSNQMVKLELEIKNATKADEIDKVLFEVEGMVKRNNLTDEEAKLTRAKIYQAGTQSALNVANTSLSEKARWKLGQDIALGYEKIAIDLVNAQARVGANKLRGIEGKAELQKIENQFIIDMQRNAVDWGKLNVEQQKIFVDGIKSITGGILGARGKTTTTERVDGKGNVSHQQTTTNQN